MTALLRPVVPEVNNHSGFIKRTKADEYRAQHRGGKGIKGAKLREDDVVDHYISIVPEALNLIILRTTN